MGKTFSACEIVELAIQIEKNGKDFYTKLIDITDDPEIAKIFTYLADAEETHIATFRSIFDSACKYEPEGAYPDEYFSYMNSLASQHIFTQKGKGKDVAKIVKDYNEGIDLGIKFEKESIVFYKGMKKMVSGVDKNLIGKLIDEENEHLRTLTGLKGGSKNEEC